MDFALLPGNRRDTGGAVPPKRGLWVDALLARKAFARNWMSEEKNARGGAICMSLRPQR